MSDTPRTDAAAFIETNQANALVLASFARELERENARLRAAINAAITEARSLEANTDPLVDDILMPALAT